MSERETDEAFANRFIAHPGFGFAAALDHLESKFQLLPPELHPIASTFLQSIRTTEKVCTIPYNLAWLSVVDVVKSDVGHRAMIQAVSKLDPLVDDMDVEVPKLRDQLAYDAFIEFIESEEGRERLKAGAMAFLRRSAQLAQPQLLAAAQDLISQCTVGVWAAMETFVSDFVRALINLEPKRVQKLLADDECKKRIGRTKWTLDQLLENGLDLSSKVGDMVLSENDLSDLGSMKAVLLPLFDRPAGLVEALETDSVYLLGKSRHLLVHRAGRVDAKFERETSSRWKAGTVLRISAEEVSTYAKSAVTVVERTIDGYLTSVRPE